MATFIKVIIILLLNILFINIITWLIALKGLKRSFYGSISKKEVQGFQSLFMVKPLSGPNWIHLGWVADPISETYIIQKFVEGKWRNVGNTKFGSFLEEGKGGTYRVLKRSRKRKDNLNLISEVAVFSSGQKISPSKLPKAKGEWQPIFKPEKYGTYVNDHCIFRDINGNWQLIGITNFGKGDFRTEKYFATAISKDFDGLTNFSEGEKLADFNTLAWAPFVLKEKGQYHLFWSPHQLHHMVSDDGINWNQHKVIMNKPYHKIFRDAVIYPLSDDQWLLFATSKGKYFSQVDLYLSFDLYHWQYIRTALSSGFGSEKNFITGSMESPKIIKIDNRFYLSITYNNESSLLAGIFLQFKCFLNKKDYNNTLIFTSTNPFNFGFYSGKRNSPTFIGKITAHAPNYIKVSQKKWMITTAGWPFASTITKGEVAIREFEW